MKFSFCSINTFVQNEIMSHIHQTNKCSKCTFVDWDINNRIIIGSILSSSLQFCFIENQKWEKVRGKCKANAQPRVILNQQQDDSETETQCCWMSYFCRLFSYFISFYHIYLITFEYFPNISCNIFIFDLLLINTLM